MHAKREGGWECGDGDRVRGAQDGAQDGAHEGAQDVAVPLQESPPWIGADTWY